MIEIGRLCVKLAGREAGKKAIVVDIIDNNFVLIDGNVKRRKCNITHLEMLPEKFEIKKGASTEDVKEVLKHHHLLEEHEKVVSNKRQRKGGEQKKAEKKKKEVKKTKKNEEEQVEAALAKV